MIWGLLSVITYCSPWFRPISFLSDGKLVPFPRDWMSSQIRVWRMPASHLRPLLDESQRFLVAWRVFAVHRVSTAPHQQLLLQRKETLLQTRLPTVSTVSGKDFSLSLPLYLTFSLSLSLSFCAVIRIVLVIQWFFLKSFFFKNGYIGWFLLTWPRGLLCAKVHLKRHSAVNAIWIFKKM